MRGFAAWTQSAILEQGRRHTAHQTVSEPGQADPECKLYLRQGFLSYGEQWPDRLSSLGLPIRSAGLHVASPRACPLPPGVHHEAAAASSARTIMRAITIWRLVFAVLGLALLIPGAVLLYQSTSCDDDDDGGDCSSDAGIALTVVGSLVILLAACNFCLYGSSSGGSGQRVDPVTAEWIRDASERGRIAGDAMAQQNAQQQQWINQQQAQMQWSINNPS